MIHRKPQLTAFLGTLCYVLMAGAPALADDTEIFTGTAGSNSLPNVVFIIDTSGSMQWSANCIANDNSCADLADSDINQRLYIVKDVFHKLINNTSGINVAVMRFDKPSNGNGNNNMGGYFIQPMQELNATNRPGINAAVDSLTFDGQSPTAGGRTPLAETLYEATQYYRGGAVEFGDNTSPAHNVTGVLAPQNTSRYLSPITQECNQSNHIVLLTDGSPTDDGDADTLIQGLPGYNSGSCGFSNDPIDDCLDELAHYLHNNDLSTINGNQTVTTHTIGFTTNTDANTLLSTAATNGGGQFKPAATASELSTALAEILNNVNTDANGSFVSPALGVDAFNRTSHRNALYFALFQNNNKRIWDGNVKSYKLGGDPIRIVDASGANALTSSGEFVTTSRSLWSTAADGAQVIDGGANAQIPVPASRHLYTKAANTAGALTALSAADPALFNIATGDTAADEAARDAIVATALSSKIADPLHSQLAVVNYGGTEAAPDVTLFVGTNAGFLHAINATTGVEQFAYAPKELLPTNVTQLGASGSHLYGLDGSPTIWMNDANGNGVVYAANGALETGEHVYAYIGMRRGGRNYYALDVTNRSAPELKWVIEGGSANFTELGQTWSKPVLAKMLHNDTATKVLIFAGGYDANQDNYIPSTADTVGRAIYIVDASTGVRLWWAGPTGSGADVEVASFTHSIPSNVRVIDSNRDGYADRLYVGDMGGNVFRADLSDSSGITGSVTLLADLGGASPDNRRFYYAPDVVLTQTAPGAPMYFSINIGSGYREHPKDKGDSTATPPRAATNDRFYSIKDFHVHDHDFSSYTAVTESAMLDVTSNDIGEGTGDTRQNAIDALNSAANHGWYIRLTTTGEKVLAESLTVNGTIYFTTYVPPSSTVSTTSCVPPIGNGRLYKVSLFNATPVVDNNANGSKTVTDRFITLDQGGIPPAPAMVFVPPEPPEPPCTVGCTEPPPTDPNPPGDPTPVVCAGPQCDPDPVTVKMYRTYWKQQ